MNEDAHYVYTVTYSDIDVGDVVAISAPVKPNWPFIKYNFTYFKRYTHKRYTRNIASRVFNVTLRLNDGEATTDQSLQLP